MPLALPQHPQPRTLHAIPTFPVRRLHLCAAPPRRNTPPATFRLHPTPPPTRPFRTIHFAPACTCARRTGLFVVGAALRPPGGSDAEISAVGSQAHARVAWDLSIPLDGLFAANEQTAGDRRISLPSSSAENQNSLGLFYPLSGLQACCSGASRGGRVLIYHAFCTRSAAPRTAHCTAPQRCAAFCTASCACLLLTKQ